MRGGLRAKTLKKHATDSIKYLSLLKKYTNLKNQCRKCEFVRSNKSASSPIQAWTENNNSRPRSQLHAKRMTPKTKHDYHINKYYSEICKYYEDVDKYLSQYDPESDFSNRLLSKLKANNAINAFDVYFTVNGKPVRFNEACPNLKKHGEITKIEQRQIAPNPRDRLKGTISAKKSDLSPIPLKPRQPLQDNSVAERSSPNVESKQMPRFDESALIEYYELVQTRFENMMNYLITSDSVCLSIDGRNNYSESANMLDLRKHNCDLLKQSVELLIAEIKDKLDIYKSITEAKDHTNAMITYLNAMNELLVSLKRSVQIQKSRSSRRSTTTRNDDPTKEMLSLRHSVAFDIPPPNKLYRSQSAK